MEDLENKFNTKKKELEECNGELDVCNRVFNSNTLTRPQKIKRSIKELQAKEKEITDRRDRCADATKKLRTGLRIFKVRDTLLKMGDEGDQTRREIVEAERMQFAKSLVDEKKALKTFLAEQRVRVPYLFSPLLSFLRIAILSATAECFIISAGSNKRYIRRRHI